MGCTCSTHGAKMNANRILVGNPEGKRSLGDPHSHPFPYLAPLPEGRVETCSLR
jgi:hypothetical protein